MLQPILLAKIVRLKLFASNRHGQLCIERLREVMEYTILYRGFISETFLHWTRSPNLDLIRLSNSNPGIHQVQADRCWEQLVEKSEPGAFEFAPFG